MNAFISSSFISWLFCILLNTPGAHFQEAKSIGIESDSIPVSSFAKALMRPGVRILQEKGWYIWDCSPIVGEDGKIHVFYSRWRDDFTNWQRESEVSHAVADQPEGPYRYVGTVLKGRGGDYWDANTIHNPTIQKVGDKYVIFYMANNLADTTKYYKQPWIGMAIADNLNGPFRRVGNGPILPMPTAQDWDRRMNNNAAFLQQPNGQFWLYYKGKDSNSGLRKIGVAFAKRLTGPYKKYEHNPVLDFSNIGKQIEDPYVFFYKNKYYMICRDMGVINPRVGLLVTSDDGLHWSNPQLAYHKSSYYFDEAPDRFERPQILFMNGRPAYLFLSLKGGEYHTSTGAVLRIDTTKF